MSEPASTDDFLRTLLRVAWLSVLLGLLLEAVLLVLAGGAGKVPALAAIVADTVQKVSWSALVCAGLSLGTAASRGREPAMGIAGLLAAPLAFNVARALHKGASQALSAPAAPPGGPSPVLLSIVKAVEYAILGIALARLGRKGRGAGAHAAVGLATGIAVGGPLLLLTTGAGTAPAAVLARATNEILFPVGCALVLYSAGALGKRLSRPAA